MASATRGDGVIIDYDDQVFALARARPRPRHAAARRGRPSFDAKPHLLTPATAAGDAETANVGARQWADRLVARGVVARAGETVVLGAGPTAPTARRRAAPPRVPTRLTVPLAADEQAVVIVEGDGVLAWRFGHPADASALGAVRPRRRAHWCSTLTFRRSVRPSRPPAPQSAAGCAIGWVWDAWLPKESAPARTTAQAALASPQLLFEVTVVAAKS